MTERHERPPLHLTPRGARGDGACARRRGGRNGGSAGGRAAEDRHALAKYQGTPNGDRHGEVCDNFQPPDVYKFVQGEIGPNGWRQLVFP